MAALLLRLLCSRQQETDCLFAVTGGPWVSSSDLLSQCIIIIMWQMLSKKKNWTMKWNQKKILTLSHPFLAGRDWK